MGILKIHTTGLLYIALPFYLFWPLRLTRHILQSRKIWVVNIGMLVVVNSTMGSSLPSNAIPIISKYFHITSTYADILPISMYLVGYVLGPLLFGPLSETYGRKVIMLLTFGGFTIFTMACAVAPNFPALLIFRLLTGICASSPIAVVGGIYADIHNDPVSRGRSMSVFMGVSGPKVVINSCLTVSGNLHRPSRRADHFGLHWSNHWLAVGLLDRAYLRRRLMDRSCIPP
jgi:MFS family permease